VIRSRKNRSENNKLLNLHIYRYRGFECLHICKQHYFCRYRPTQKYGSTNNNNEEILNSNNNNEELLNSNNNEELFNINNNERLLNSNNNYLLNGNNNEV
jgi:hypothetical protein